MNVSNKSWTALELEERINIAWRKLLIGACDRDTKECQKWVNVISRYEKSLGKDELPIIE